MDRFLLELEQKGLISDQGYVRNVEIGAEVVGGSGWWKTNSIELQTLGGRTRSGSEQADVINGGDFDDTLAGRGGNDTISGGAGTDTAVFSGAQANYTISLAQSGTLTVTDRTGTDGTDTLTNVEQLQFTGNTIDLSAFVSTANLASTQFTELAKMYAAYFNRAPDATGLYFWADKLAEGMSLQQIAEFFFDQPETRALYPDTSDTGAFVTQVYANVLG
ncbi:MAG: DUF4214 domain-containing protein, partial [Phaeodactylibacter sp.]|nr:DUF4214 domain-containing protein [Phaeodactylibacter sp.]